MDSTIRIKASPEVLSRTLGEEAVLLDLRSGTYFGLSPVGARIWQLALEGLDIGQIVKTLVSEFEADLVTIEADVEKLTEELVKAGLAQLE